MADQNVQWTEIVLIGGANPILRFGAIGGNDELLINAAATTGASRLRTTVQNMDVSVDAGGSFTFEFLPEPVRIKTVTFTNFERFVVLTGEGADFIATGNGADTVNSGAGDDNISTRAGVANIDGGAGFDRWQADYSALTSAVQILLTSPSSQSIVGVGASTLANVEVLGNNPDTANQIDYFRLGSGNDTVLTSTGTTVFFSDYIDMGAGDDVVTVRGGQDFVRGGAGIDTLIVDYGASATGIVLGVNPANRTTGSFGGERTNGGTWYSVDFIDMEKFVVTGSNAADSFSTGDFDDVVSSRDGDDTITTYRGGVIVDGGAGTDRWTADFSNVTTAISLNLTSNTLTGVANSSVANIESIGLSGENFLTGSGDDVVDTRALNLADLIRTNAGNDTVTLRGGNDFVDLGGGVGDDDLLILDYSAAFNVINGPSSFTGDDATGSYTAGGIGGVQFTGVERVWLFGGDNAVAGDSMAGMAGNDIIVLNAGDDNGQGGDGNDAMLGGLGNDTLAGQNGNDLLMGGSDYDPLATGSGNDTLNGGDGIDTIFGQDGVDTINGGLGADYVLAGAGNDVVNGGDGDDFLLAGGAWALNAANAGNDTINGGNGVDFIAGGTGDDTLNGDAGDDIVYGGDGIDTINGGVGSDSLFGGGGNDVFNTSGGTDFAYGEAGADRLNVNAGTAGTTFFYADASDTLRFQGFGAAVDTFAELQAFMTPDYYGPGSVLITLPGSVTVVVFGLTLTAGNTSFG